MLASATTTLLRCLVAAALVLTLVSICSAPLAFAGVSFNTIDPVAIVTDNGSQIIVTGPITCTKRQRAFLRVRVTQRATGAVATGRTRLLCTGEAQHWAVQAAIHGDAPFQEGQATAVAFGRTFLREDSTDAHQWLVDIALRRE